MRIGGSSRGRQRQTQPETETAGCLKGNWERENVCVRERESVCE